jgi:hypothetical protein
MKHQNPIKSNVCDVGKKRRQKDDWLLCEQNKLANFDLFLAKCVSTGFFKKAL